MHFVWDFQSAKESLIVDEPFKVVGYGWRLIASRSRGLWLNPHLSDFAAGRDLQMDRKRGSEPYR